GRPARGGPSTRGALLFVVGRHPVRLFRRPGRAPATRWCSGSGAGTTSNGFHSAYPCSKRHLSSSTRASQSADAAGGASGRIPYRLGNTRPSIVAALSRSEHNRSMLLSPDSDTPPKRTGLRLAGFLIFKATLPPCLGSPLLRREPAR